MDAKNDIIKILIRLFRRTTADPAPINVYNICKAARKDGIKVLIGSTAGDDIFSGYRRHQALVFGVIEIIPKYLRKQIKNISLKLNAKNIFIRRFKTCSKSR